MGLLLLLFKSKKVCPSSFITSSFLYIRQELALPHCGIQKQKNGCAGGEGFLTTSGYPWPVSHQKSSGFIARH